MAQKERGGYNKKNEGSKGRTVNIFNRKFQIFQRKREEFIMFSRSEKMKYK